MHMPIITLAAAVSSVAARTVTVKNNCGYTVWPAVHTFEPLQYVSYSEFVRFSPTLIVEMLSQTNQLAGKPIQVTSGASTGTRDDIGIRVAQIVTSAGSGSCLTGDCEGGLECVGSYQPPTTVAEWTFGQTGDFYDVSVVDGFNIPMAITNNMNCPDASCPVDLNQNCPEVLRGPTDSEGQAVGCNSDCLVDPNPSDSPSCCTGSHSTPATCPPSRIPHYSFFKNNCPRALAFAYDELSGGTLGPCAGKRPDYTLTFCP
ncbi:hypothetical protein VNI00_014638 [Paramarasmius palmivorus]|uniref:Thaumatin-like protein n=1 Tax=Paramarasmius palmivorus TaxID=297713 RepID=A0AAW0BSM4_9AGAR